MSNAVYDTQDHIVDVTVMVLSYIAVTLKKASFRPPLYLDALLMLTDINTSLTKPPAVVYVYDALIALYRLNQ